MLGCVPGSLMNTPIEDIEFMKFERDQSELKKKSQKGMDLPQMSAVSVKVTMYKRGSKSSEVDTDEILKEKLTAILAENPPLKFEVEFGLRDELER